MPKYRKLRIEPGTGAQESNAGLPAGKKPEHVDTPLKKTPSDFKPFKGIINLTDPDNYPVGFIVTSSTGILQAERILTAGTGILITDNGPNDTIEIALSPSAIGEVVVFINGSSIGQSSNINFTSNNIDISGNYNSATGNLDIFLSATPAFSISIHSSAKNSGETIIETSGLEISHKPIEGKGAVEVHTSSNNKLVISAPPLSVSASAASSGVFIISEISSNETVYKTFFGGGTIEISSDTDNIYISAAPAQIPDIELSSLGSGIFLLVGTSGHEIFQRALDGRGNIEISLDSDTIVISSIPQNLSLSALSNSGISFVSQVSGLEIGTRTIEGGLGLEENLVGEKIVIDEYWINANNSQRFSTDPVANGQDSIAIGNDVKTSGQTSFGIGKAILIEGKDNIVVGTSASVTGDENIIIGKQAGSQTSANNLIQIGSFLNSYGSGNTIQIGYSDAGSYSIHLGYTNGSPAFKDGGEYNYVFGFDNNIQNIRSLVIGTENDIDDDGTVTARSVNIAIGSANYILGPGNNLTIGEKNTVFGSSNFVLGMNSQASFDNSFSIGFNNNAKNKKVFIFGTGISATQSSSMSFGIDNVSLFIDNNGFIGINTQNPSERLEVKGNAKFEKVIVSSETNYSLPISAGVSGYILTTRGDGNISVWRDPLSLFPASKNWIHANEGNDFSSAPVASATNAIAIGYNVRASAPYAIAIGNSYEVSAEKSFSYGVSGKPLFFINASGKTGIGTSNPQATLDIRGDEESIIQFINSATGTGVLSGSVIGLSSKEFIIENYEDSRILMRLNRRDRFVINNDEFVFSNGDIFSSDDNNYKIILLQGDVVSSSGYVPLLTESGNEITIPTSSIYGFTIEVVGKEDGTDQAAYYEWRGLVRRPNSTSAVSFITFPLQNIISESVSAVEWNVKVSAASAKLKVLVTTGSSSPVITRWMGVARLMKIKG